MAQKPQRLLIVAGPESSGKTTLADWLAAKLSVPLVPEIARSYLEIRSSAVESDKSDIEPGYSAEDVAEIAQLQQREEDSVLAGSGDVVVADTDYRTIELWWQEKFSDQEFIRPTPSRHSLKAERSYLLCLPDLPWQPDPLRENPFDRHRLFALQMQGLEADAAEYRVIWGEGAFRRRLAWQYVKSLLGE